MNKYRVYLSTGAGLSVRVAAEDAEAAVDAAFDVAQEQYLCAHCTGSGKAWGLDLGEWELDNEPGSVVLDDSGSADDQ